MDDVNRIASFNSSSSMHEGPFSNGRLMRNTNCTFLSGRSLLREPHASGQRPNFGYAWWQKI